MSKPIIAPVFAAVLIIFCATAVHAGSGAGAINLSFNTSARAEGLGGAGAALCWDDNPGHWANPALIGFRPGIHYIDFESQLAVGLADDIVITDQQLVLGAYGVGLLLGRGPLEGNYLDMGEQTATDENGEPLASFNSYMKADYWGLSLDGVRAAEALLGKGEGTWTRHASLSGGWVWKEFEDRLAPDDIIQGSTGGGAQGNCEDKGWMVRLTPLNLGFEGDPFEDKILGVTLGGSYGASTLNGSDEMIRHVDADQSDPFPTAYVKGWTLRFAVPWTQRQKAVMNEAGFGILGDMLDPFFSVTLAGQKSQPGYYWDDDLDDYVYGKDDSGEYDEKGDGWEVGFANILYLRQGHTEALYGDIDGPTSGWGINLQAGKYAGFRWDAATVPQARGLPAVERRSWSMWCDPVAIFVK